MVPKVSSGTTVQLIWSKDLSGDRMTSDALAKVTGSWAAIHAASHLQPPRRPTSDARRPTPGAQPYISIPCYTLLKYRESANGLRKSDINKARGTVKYAFGNSQAENNVLAFHVTTKEITQCSSEFILLDENNHFLMLINCVLLI